MSLSYSQLTEPITREAATSDLLDLLESRGFRATAWQEGSIPLALVTLGGHLFAKASEYWGYVARQGYLDDASGDGLTHLAESTYDETRGAAIATQIIGRFTVASGSGPHTVGIGDVVIQDAAGHTFRNVAGLGIAYPVALTSAATTDLLMESEIAGSAANVADNVVTQLVTTYAGVSVTNPPDPPTYTTSIVRTGLDASSDATLAALCGTKWARLSIQSARAGIEHVCLAASDGVAKVWVDDSNPRGAGTFDAYLASAHAPAGAADVADAQDGIDAVTFDNSAQRGKAIAAVGRTVDVAGTIWHDASISSADAQMAVEAALLELLDATPIGGWDFSPGPSNVLRVGAIEDAIRGATSGGTTVAKTVTITVPAADISLGSSEVATLPASYSISYVAVG